MNRLAEHVAAREDAMLESALPDEAARRAIAERAAFPRAKIAASAGVWRIALPAFTAVALVLLLSTFWVLRAPKQADVTFTVGEPPRAGAVGEWIAAPPAEEVPLRFSDGTRARLEPASRGRVVRTTARGAELVLEAGRARFEVQPGENTDYRVRSGPFEVLVTGTRFFVAWSSERDEFELDLEEGRVRVLGCGMGDGVSLDAGHRLRASCRPAKFSVSSPGEASAPQERTTVQRAPELAPSSPSDPSAATEPPASRAAKRSAPPQVESSEVPGASWAALARQGYFQKAYEAAVAAGFDAEAARAPAGDLLLLGDCARLGGHADRAAQVYLGVRQRFPGSGAAAQAAFYLGRLGAAGGAGRWFETYLAEEPRGPLAEAALGRLLELEVRHGDRERALALARRYLAHHPSGPHAKAAREILGAPAED